MAKLTIRISDEELSWLNILAKTQGVTKTQIVRAALQRVFEDAFIDRIPIKLPHEPYQALLEFVGKPFSAEEIEGRKRLAKVQNWEL